MPAARGPLVVEAGSFEPFYWDITNPDTGQPLDITAPGYAVHGVVASRRDGSGTVLLDLPSSSDAWSVVPGRVYFQPHSVDSSVWTFRRGFYQFELDHPTGETVRIAADRFYVDPELTP